MSLPLHGLTVVSLEQAVAAPFATRQMADLGARVIKIERPGEGDFARSYDTAVKGLSSYFVWLNRSKESLTLDLKKPGAREIFARLIGRADVFVQNVAPGAADRLGTTPSSLRAAHPRLIVCSVSGYGTHGPYANRKAYDLLVQSEVGLLSITGTPDAPSKAGISVADIAAGMYAFSGMLAALVSRHATGQGTTVDVSLFDALGEWMSAPAYQTTYGGGEPPRVGPNHATIAPYGPIPVRDGHVTLAIQNAREWTRFCADVLDRPALADDPRFRTNPLRVQHRDALARAIDEVFRGLTAAEALARLDRAGLASARQNTVAEFVSHPQNDGRWRQIATPAGPVDARVPPISIGGDRPVMGPVPALGEHTDAILGELGFDAAAIAALRKEQVI